MIDRAQAPFSALAKGIEERLRPLKENWIPAHTPGLLKKGEERAGRD